MEHRLKVLFWNFKIPKKSARKRGAIIAQREDVILSLLNQNRPDLLLFAEGDKTLKENVNSYVEIPYEYRLSAYRLFEAEGGKLFLYYRDHLENSISVKYFDTDLQNRLVYLYLKHYELFFIALHLIDPRNHTVDDRLIHAIRVRQKIEKEKVKMTQLIRAYQNRTFIIGDFNMNPYDAGMTALDAFASVPTEAHLPEINSKNPEGRKSSSGKVFNRDHFLINPCWKQLSDLVTPGSHIYRKSFELLSWRLIDQCLCSLELFPYLERIEYITKIGQNDWYPLDISDHLPLFVEFDFNAMPHE